jgi:hypothetical protein
VAEEMHAETHNAECILQAKTARAFTDRDPEWSSVYNMKKNDPATDLIVGDNGFIGHRAQVKVCQNSEQTANAFRETREGIPYYGENDSYVAPSDQVHPSDGSPSIAEHAHRTFLKNAETRPKVAEGARMVEKKVTDRLDGKSRPFSKREFHAVAKNGQEGKDLRSDYQNGYMTKSTIQQIRRASAGAAGIAAIMAGTINTVQYLRLVREGKITPGQAIGGIIKNTAVASADSALKAAVATGAVSVITRVSAVSANTVAKQAVNSMLGRSGIAGAGICAVDLIECMVLVAAGKMTPAEMETRAGKNILQTAAAVWGSYIGANIAVSLGIATGLAPILAGMAGGLIAGVAVTIAIENHVEKPYREVIANTESLVAAEYAMRDSTEALALGQKAFAAFLLEDRDMGKKITAQLDRIRRAGDDMGKAIDRL